MALDQKPIVRILIFVIILFGFTHVSADIVTPAFVPGEPGLSYRYVETFGETSVPYFIDPEHLYYPEGVAVDATGNLWIAETEGRRALKYAGDGAFLMSIGTPGSVSVDEYHFYNPSDIVVDGDGNIWVTDRFSSRAIKYDSGGTYLAQLGAGDSGSDNDHFAYPTGVALDGTGRIYVSDSDNHRVQVFDSNGVYSITLGITGEPGSDNAHFQNPSRMAIDDADNLYVTDTFNHRVQVFDGSHTYVATLGVTGESGSDNNHLDGPRGVEVDASFIYIADSNNNRVQIFDRGTFTYQHTLGWGTGNYELNRPMDVGVDSNGNIYVADYLNFRVQKYDSSLAYVSTFGSTGVPYLTDSYHYNNPSRIAVDAMGNIGLVEGGHRLIILDSGGEIQLAIGEPGVMGWDNEHFNSPTGVAFDASGNVYISECGNRVQIFNSSDGVFQATLGVGWGTGDYEFNCPGGVAVDSSGNIYIADDFNYRVQIFDSSLSYVATVGVTGEPGSDNDHFNDVQDVAVDSEGNIYIADTGNHRVQIFDSSRVWQTTLGTTGECGDDFAHFCAPTSVAVDSDGNIYVGDGVNHRVQVFDAKGAYLTTLGGAQGSLNGQLWGPVGVEVDTSGNLYIGDTGNHRIQKFAPGVPGWRQANLNGFGDRQNGAITSLATYQEDLYAGTLRLDGTGAQLWRSSDGVTWAFLMTDGFGNPHNTGIDHLLEFDGYLYAGTWGDEPNGGEVWRSPNGLDWTQVVSKGFGDPTNTEVVRFVVFNDRLYASTVSYNDPHGTELWRSSSGNPGTWERVAANGFNDDSGNVAALSLHVFDGYLYGGTWNESTGGEVWRSSNGTTWNQVNQDGFGTVDNQAVSALASFQGSLYAATRGTPGVSGDQVWRCQVCDGSDWKEVVNNGFGNNETGRPGALQVLGNYLYLVAGNEATGAEVWRTANGTKWEQIGFAGLGDSNNSQTYVGNSIGVFKDRLFIGLRNHANGGEVWSYTGFPIYLPFTVRNTP